jgi:hypothetical protein
MATFRIIGRVVEPKKRQGLGGLRVEAWDKDLILDDLVGSAITSEDGAFSMEFDEHYFQELFFDRNPDLFFRVFNQRHLLMSTENSILWNVTAGEIPILLEVPMDTHFNNQLAPDRLPLKPAQAKRLARMTGLKAEEFVGQSVADLGERMKWRIDPKFFFFQRVCGKVVKKDPISGKTCPVPFATVDVEDTDFHFLSYFPSGSPWAWHFWLAIDRETIATTKTSISNGFGAGGGCGSVFPSFFAVHGSRISSPGCPWTWWGHGLRSPGQIQAPCTPWRRSPHPPSTPSCLIRSDRGRHGLLASKPPNVWAPPIH